MFIKTLAELMQLMVLFTVEKLIFNVLLLLDTINYVRTRIMLIFRFLRLFNNVVNCILPFILSVLFRWVHNLWSAFIKADKWRSIAPLLFLGIRHCHLFLLWAQIILEFVWALSVVSKATNWCTRKVLTSLIIKGWCWMITRRLILLLLAKVKAQLRRNIVLKKWRILFLYRLQLMASNWVWIPLHLIFKLKIKWATRIQGIRQGRHSFLDQ